MAIRIPEFFRLDAAQFNLELESRQSCTESRILELIVRDLVETDMDDCHLCPLQSEMLPPPAAIVKSLSCMLQAKLLPPDRFRRVIR